MESVKILNVAIDKLATKDLLEKLKDGGVVFTPNVDHLVKLQKDSDFFDVYSQADYIVCDSKVLMYVSHFLGNSIQEKISGSDLFPAFYQYYRDDESMKIFLLGAAEGVAEQARQNINARVGRNMVVAAHSPSYGFEKNEAECQRIIEIINQSDATVLAVGVGAPKQEKWICKYRDQLKGIKVFLAIGATIDFEAGCTKRSPRWMSGIGLEWLYRLMQEPERLWKRYLVESLPFFGLVLRQKLRLYNYKIRIGNLLQQAGLLSGDQVSIVLKIKQENPDLLFGEIVAQQGWLKPETIEFFAEILPQLLERHRQEPIGEYLKLAGLLDEAQISQILQEQQQVNLRFGEIAIAKGWVKPKTIKFILTNFKDETNPGSETKAPANLNLNEAI
ncbi:MAG: WecB/TagA/CpsF family glycosyltransferase [Oscillatoriales cyanobacterium RM2_1_1]|nr:WecB/TagA/CpsF family glycosyltransferase [Oscillatoriales cyanobacterium SM2_3_0]NJO44522.1 WecB/TagA/CpsF family glycosyltransferase [Oscillatoriales cyanobacterium RM2_1_1]